MTGFWSDVEGKWVRVPGPAPCALCCRIGAADDVDDDTDDAKSESRRYHSTTTTTTTKNTYRFRTTTTARGFSPCLRHSSCRLSVLRCPGEAIRICLSESTGRQARSTNTHKYRSLFGWRRRRRRIQAIGTRLRTSVQVGRAHPSAIYLRGSGLGGWGVLDRETWRRPAGPPSGIFSPARPAAAPVAFVDVFVSCVGGGGALSCLPRGRWCRFPRQPENHKQSSQFCWAAARRPPPCRRSEIRLCARVLPGAGGLRQQIARLDTGGAVVGGMGVYGYRALFLWFGCEAGSFEITSRGE